MGIDEKGQDTAFSRKGEICRNAYNILTKELDFPPEDIIFDPVVLPVGTGFKEHNDYAVNLINTIAWIRKNLPHAKVIAGISNISFAFRGNEYLRKIINSVFLKHCEKAGLNFAILDTEKIIGYDDIPERFLRSVNDLILNRRKDSTDRFINIANRIFNSRTEAFVKNIKKTQKEFQKNSRGDDVLIFNDDSRDEVIMEIPMLRQQQITNDAGYTLSMADFVAPVESGVKDYIGGFAATTGLGIDRHVNRLKENGDSYNSIMFRLIANRLVEASAEMMHEWVRRKYWGYDPDEDLSIKDQIKGKYSGIRPAVGYPALPDHRTKKYLFELLNVEERIGICLTDIYAMKPANSVSGFYLAHNASRYFGIGKIGKDQLLDYAIRTGQNIESTEKWLCFSVD